MTRKNEEMNDYSKNHALIPLYIMDILKDSTDEEHRFYQKEIQAALEEEYGIVMERKAVSRYINSLIDMGLVAKPEGKNGCYYNERPFGDRELQLLLYSVACNSNISQKEAENLVAKLRHLSHRQEAVLYSLRNTERKSEGPYVISENLKFLDNAIVRRRKVRFTFYRYNCSKELAPAREVLFTPLAILSQRQRMVVAGFDEGMGEYTAYPLPFITDMEDEGPAGSYQLPPDFVKDMDVTRLYRQEEREEDAKITFTCHHSLVDEVIDRFGKDIQLKRSRGQADLVEVTLKRDGRQLENWLLGHVHQTEVIFPPAFRERMKNSIIRAAEIYEARCS